MDTSKNQDSIFPLGNKAPAEYFTGTAYVKLLIEIPALNTSVANVVFEAGCRNNWHNHKGKPIQLLKTGDVVEILPSVIHWHGATPESKFAHIAIGPNADLGAPNWMEPVTDEEYYSYKDA
jgi:quercetin dioxygenase-like cupin family protein